LLLVFVLRHGQVLVLFFVFVQAQDVDQLLVLLGGQVHLWEQWGVMRLLFQQVLQHAVEALAYPSCRLLYQQLLALAYRRPYQFDA
jgi:hypothetical protein